MGYNMQLQQCYIQYVPVAVPFAMLQLTLQLTKLLCCSVQFF